MRSTAKIRLPRFRAETGELRTLETDFVLPLPVRGSERSPAAWTVSSARGISLLPVEENVSPGLLKKAQMQGGTPGTHPLGNGHPSNGYPVRGVLNAYVAAPCERGAPAAGGSPQMGLFSAAR